MEFNKEQKEIINNVNGNMVVIADAGSGKTSALTHRIMNMIQNHNIKPENILAITFSAKAKEEMYDRIKKMSNGAGFEERVNISTFHALALKILYNADRSIKVWKGGYQKEQLVTEIVKSLGLYVDDKVPYNEIVQFIAHQKHNMLKPGQSLLPIDNMPYRLKEMGAIYEKYEAHKEKNHLVEFDDFLGKACEVLIHDPVMLNRCHQYYHYVLSDEFQDVSMDQELFLRLIGAGHNNVMVVGDWKQSIYGFRGGISKYILEFDKVWKDTKVVNLNTNYRCSRDIVEAANRLIANAAENKIEMHPSSVASHPAFKKPEFRKFGDDEQEAEYVRRKIAMLKETGYNYDDFTILARTNAQLSMMEIVLRNANLPYETFDGKTFLDRAEVKLVMAYLKLAKNQNDDESFAYIYNKPNRYLGNAFFAETTECAKKRGLSLFFASDLIGRRNWKFQRGIDEIQRIIHALKSIPFDNVGEMIKFLRVELDIDYYVSKGQVTDDGSSSEQSENLDSFEKICGTFKNLDEFFAYADAFSNNKAENEEENSKKIRLMTIHKSKGLEFPVVFIIGCSDGLLPHARGDIEDERKLLYVGITRAEKELYLSHIDTYKGRFFKTSPFVDELGDTIERKDEVKEEKSAAS